MDPRQGFTVRRRLEPADDFEPIRTRLDQQYLAFLCHAVDHTVRRSERELLHFSFTIAESAGQEFGAEEALSSRPAGASIEISVE